MSDSIDHLFEGHCQSCESGVGRLDDAEIAEGLERLPGWTRSDDGDAIHREFRFKNFYRTMAFVNAVAWIANTEDHHPDLTVGYGSCGVTFTTHAADGLTRNDFICALAVQRLLRDDSTES